MKHPQSKLIHTQINRTREKENSSPMFLTSSFCFDDAEQMRAAFADENDNNIYSRFSNPNIKEFVDRMCLLENAEAGYATASGMSALFACFMAFLKAGDHILTCSSIFGSTHTIITKYLSRWGISYSYVPAIDLQLWEAAIKPNTKMIFLETPTNPGLEVIDLKAVGEMSKKYELLFLVDNCFATPIIQKPLEFGADLVMHSATKWLDGQGRVLGGIVLGKKSLIHEIYLFCRSTGPALSPFNAWLLSKSLETLELRMEKHSANALNLSRKLIYHDKIHNLRYPLLFNHPQYDIAFDQMKTGGGVFCFEMNGGLKAGKTFLDNLHMISVTANLGETKTIASHPASTTHAKLTDQERKAVNITPGLIRISAGLENCDDILADILQALAKT